jgi:NifU-like protein involved in Fe-S cluster formation
VQIVKIVDDKLITFGWGSAIASSSLATEWLKGKTIEEAQKIKNTDIVHELNLPPVKIHCSVLAEDAIKAALSDYQKKSDGALTDAK